MFTLPLADLGRALGLKRSGKTFAGPCPYCGGRDRFFLGPGKLHEVVFGCRNCGKDTGPIIRALIELGLWQDSNQEQVVQRRYNPDDIMYVDVFLMMYANGQQPTADDLIEVQQRLHRVDSMRQIAIKRVMEHAN